MIRNSRTQTGSAHVVIIIILIVVIVGAVGFGVWKNFLSTEGGAPAAETSEVKDSDELPQDTEASIQRTYTNNDFSFSYPNEGWSVGETRYGENAPITAELKSANYEQMGMGVDKGAIISVYINETPTTLDKEFANLQTATQSYGLEDLRKTTIGGKAAITYHSAYEGVRYHTVFVHNQMLYDVIYMYEYDGVTSTYSDTYELVTSSLKFVE